MSLNDTIFCNFNKYKNKVNFILEKIIIWIDYDVNKKIEISDKLKNNYQIVRSSIFLNWHNDKEYW
mgnify:FL=1